MCGGGGGDLKKTEKIGAIYQLKKTSDYSQNDPPGPERNVGKNMFWHFLDSFWSEPFSSGWRLAAGAFFLAQIAFLQEKDNFPRLAACRRRFVEK